MKRFAKVENGVVKNVILSQAAIGGHDVEVSSGVSKGWVSSDGVFAPPEAPEETLTQDQLRTAVNNERIRRLQTLIEFNGVIFDFNQDSLDNISGAATLAGFAMGAGAVAGNYLWHGGTESFVWIAHDNSLVQMDAPTAFEFGRQAANWKSRHVFAARVLKDTTPIPDDYADDIHWPTQPVVV